MKIYRKCPMCNEITSKEIPDELAPALDRYANGIGYIQDIPLDVDTREFIKTGYCQSCMELLFSFFNDDDEEVSE